MIWVLFFLVPADVQVSCPWAPPYRPVPPVTGMTMTLPSSFDGPVAIMVPPVSVKLASQVASWEKLNVQL